jgi:hypothetical protein
MTMIEFEQGAFRIDARVVAEGLAIEPVRVQPLMREGKITSLCECGVGEDAGRYRLAFFHENRVLRIVVDEDGNVIEQSTADIGAGRRSPPRSKRKGRT